MPYYAWYSKKTERARGTATWVKPDGKEVEVCFVVDGPDELSVEINEPVDDLVFMGEVVKCTRLATELPWKPEDCGRPEDYVDPGDFE